MKKLLFLLLAFMATVAVNAEQVSRQQALQKAKQFMPGKQFGEAKSFARAGSPTDQEPFYIFNAEGKKGFVVVSGDDRTEPILGYSDQGEISVENMPENLEYWLECYEVQMKTLDQAKTAGSRGITRSASKAAVAPLIQTKWDQFEPYNLMCPDGSYVDYDETGYNSANRCVTGCVATAMAQVMYYHQWPESCGPINPYDIIYRYENVGTEEAPNWQPVIDHSFHGLEGTEFKWNDMALSYTTNVTGTSADAVAELMRYCGQAVNMNYGLSKNGGSSAGVSAWDMATYFNYSKNARSVYRMFYSVTEWEDMIYQELANNRPVLYGGSSASGGHEFICDGYDGNGLFHFNWGWSGGSDGFFVLSLANPQELGSGGGTNIDGYSYIQDAIIGLMKPVEGEVEAPHIYSLISDDETWVTTYTRSSAAENFVGVELPRRIFMEYDLEAKPWPNYAIDYAWGLYQDGALLGVYGTASITLTNEERWSQNVATVDLGAGLADGTYMLRQVYRPQGSDTWVPCEMSMPNGIRYYLAVSYIKAIVSGNTLILSKANEDYLSSDIIVNNVSFSPSSIEAGKAVEVTVNLTNNGDAFQELICLWLGNEMTTLVCGSVEPGKTGNVMLHFVPEYIGEIPLSISTDEDGKNVIWEGSLTVEAPKPQSLSGTMSIDGFDTNYGVLSGNKLRVRAQVTNNGTNIYDNQIKLYMYKYIEGQETHPYYTETSTNTTIQPGETKEVVLTVPDLNYDEKYFFYLYYYSGGSRQKMNVNGTGWTFSLAPLSSVQGDADGNGIVDTNDVKTVVDYIMGRDPLPFVFDNANLNGDSKVDAADLVLLIKNVP